MRRSTTIIVAVLAIIAVGVLLHTLNVASLLGALNPHALR